MSNKGFTTLELIFTVFTVGLVALLIYALVKYGNTPVSEMPVWVYWLLGK